MRTVKAVYDTEFEMMGDLTTYRALPNKYTDYIDPFLLLNHHGPQEYKPDNKGLPFGPHPHRGFETVTFIIQGDLVHKDSTGSKSIIEAGGVQWMTAGSGIIHSENSSENFKKTGGIEEVIQIWLNLPSALKMTPPDYKGLNKSDIPEYTEDNGNVKVNVISGLLNNVNGPVKSLTDTFMASVELKAGTTFVMNIPANRNILFYVVKGRMDVNGTGVKGNQLVHFLNDDDSVKISCKEDSIIIVGHSEPFNEPVVSYGPFVMNTQGEIKQAMLDYQSGKMGVWSDE